MGEPSGAEVTASAIISFVERLEDDSSRFYDKLAERFMGERETFLAFAKESERTKTIVTRTYQETITDALEACFSFRGLNLSDFLVDTSLTEDADDSAALTVALELEKKAIRFYTNVAERSGSLLATIPRAFRKAAETRSKRQLKLKLLLESLKK